MDIVEDESASRYRKLSRWNQKWTEESHRWSNCLQPPSQRCKSIVNLSLLLWKISVPSVSTFTVRTDYVTSTETDHSDSLSVSRKFHLDSFFTTTATLCSRHLPSYFPKHFKFGLFKSRVNRYLSTLSYSSFLLL